MFSLRAASVVACVAALGVSLAQGATEPFGRVSVCTPFSVLVKPGASYDVQVDAEPAVKAAVSFQVSDGTLTLETTKPFSTKAPVKVTVTLPESALEGVEVNSGSGWTVVGAGFSASKSFAASAAGNGGLLLEDLTTDSLKLSNSGGGQVIVKGRIGQADITNNGVGEVYVGKVSRGATVDSSGIGNVQISAASDSVQISGSSSGLGKLQYDQGDCSITSPFSQSFGGFGGFDIGSPFGSPCEAVPSVTAPAVNPQWTCGLQVKGSFLCNSASSGSASASGGQTSTSTSTGPGKSTVFSSASGSQRTSRNDEPSQSTSYSTDTGSARSVAGCTAPASELSMLD